MRIDDLRHHLQEQAGEIDPAQPVPLAAVRRRRAQLRHRRIATTGVAGIAVIATAVALSNGYRIDADAPPASTPSAVEPTAYPAAEPDGLPDAEPAISAKDHLQYGVRFRSESSGDTLQAATVGKPGEQSVALRWTPGDRRVDIRVFCTRPDQPAEVVLKVDGRAVTTESCSRFRVSDPGSIVAGLLDQKVLFPHPAQAVNITAEIVEPSGAPSSSPVQQVGFGIYSRADNRAIGSTPEVAFPELIEHQGHMYRIDQGLMTASFSPTMTDQGVSVQTPGFTPCVVVFASVGVPGISTFEVAGVSGGHTYTLAPGDGPLAGFKSIAIKPQASGYVEVRPVGDSPSRGLLAIGLYVPAN
jgi:hypothetical protein